MEMSLFHFMVWNRLQGRYKATKVIISSERKQKIGENLDLIATLVIFIFLNIVNRALAFISNLLVFQQTVNKL